jgi:hypothetical protein
MAELMSVALDSSCTWIDVVWHKDIVLASVIGYAKICFHEILGVSIPC